MNNIAEEIVAFFSPIDPKKHDYLQRKMKILGVPRFQADNVKPNLAYWCDAKASIEALDLAFATRFGGRSLDAHFGATDQQEQQASVARKLMSQKFKPRTCLMSGRKLKPRGQHFAEATHRSVAYHGNKIEQFDRWIAAYVSLQERSQPRVNQNIP